MDQKLTHDLTTINSTYSDVTSASDERIQQFANKVSWAILFKYGDIFLYRNDPFGVVVDEIFTETVRIADENEITDAEKVESLANMRRLIGELTKLAQ